MYRWQLLRPCLCACTWSSCMASCPCLLASKPAIAAAGIGSMATVAAMPCILEHCQGHVHVNTHGVCMHAVHGLALECMPFILCITSHTQNGTARAPPCGFKPTRLSVCSSRKAPLLVQIAWAQWSWCSMSCQQGMEGTQVSACTPVWRGNLGIGIDGRAFGHGPVEGMHLPPSHLARVLFCRFHGPSGEARIFTFEPLRQALRHSWTAAADGLTVSVCTPGRGGPPLTHSRRLGALRVASATITDLSCSERPYLDCHNIASIDAHLLRPQMSDGHDRCCGPAAASSLIVSKAVCMKIAV